VAALPDLVRVLAYQPCMVSVKVFNWKNQRKKCDIIFSHRSILPPIFSVVSSSMTAAAIPDLVWGMRYNPWCGRCFSFYLKNKSILTESKKMWLIFFSPCAHHPSFLGC
jgi:hypothetical protein